MQCPTNTAFDPNLKICRYTEDVNCLQQTTTEKPTSTTSKPTTTSQPTASTSTTVSGSSTTPRGPLNCPPTGLQPYPNPSDCSTFYLCRNGSIDIITCPVGYQFDTLETRCKLIGSAVCNGEVTSSSIKPHSTEKPNYNCGDHLNGSTFPDPTDCTKYYQCSNGNVVGNHCPPGLEFNSAFQVCDSPEEAKCRVTE